MSKLIINLCVMVHYVYKFTVICIVSFMSTANDSVSADKETKHNKFFDRNHGDIPSPSPLCQSLIDTRVYHCQLR